MAESLSRNDVLEVFAELDRPLRAGEIATKLDIRGAGYRALEALLEGLVDQGVLQERPGRRFRVVNKDKGKQGKHGKETGKGSAGGLPFKSRSDSNAQGNPQAKSNDREREGVLTLNPRGFGFVAAVGHAGDDVFISPDALMGAMHGDRVLIRVSGRSNRGAEGEITRILERGIRRVAGVLRRRGRSAWLEPDDPRIRGPIALSSEMDTRGAEGNSGNDGDAVIVTLTRYPMFSGENPEGKIEVVLGRPGELNVEVQKILALEQIEEAHSDAAVAEATAFGDSVPEEMKRGREDLTKIPLPTIDPEDARDHDDAVWVERTESGGYRAWIAIADVSSYVTPGTRIDDEAKARGCSVYLPDRAIPMLPRALSSNLCSLLPDVDRLCLCAEIELDPAGTVVQSRLIRGVMNSRAKLTYGGVARALGLTEEPPIQPKAEEMKEGLRVAYELSRILRGKRLKRGAVDFDLPEPRVILDPKTGEPTNVERRGGDPGVKRAYQLIEELMLLANETVASTLEAAKTGAVYRVHGAPDEMKLVRFANMCEALGLQFDPEDAKDPKALGGFVKSFAEHPLANVLNQLLLRSMKQAVYDVVNIGHFGLASKAYLHFTSPIRRYPDLIDHRIVHKIVLKEPIDNEVLGHKVLAEAAQASSSAERRAMEVERGVFDLYRAYLMRDKIGQEFEGTVTALVGSGIFVSLDAPFVDVLVRTEDIGPDSYELDDEALRVVARRSGEVISLGDRMRVQVTDVLLTRRTVYARRANVEGSATEERRGARPVRKFGEKTMLRSGRPGARPSADRKPSRPDKRGKPEKRDSREKDVRKGARVIKTKTRPKKTNKTKKRR